MIAEVSKVSRFVESVYDSRNCSRQALEMVIHVTEHGSVFLHHIRIGRHGNSVTCH